MLLLTLCVISLVAGDDDGEWFLCPRKYTHVGEATSQNHILKSY